MNNNALKIAFAIDERYIEQLLTTIISIVDNNHSFKEIYFYVFTPKLNDQGRIKRFEKKLPNTTIDFIEIDEKIFANFPLNISHISRVSYARLLIAEKLVGVDKILYLDADVLVLKDLSALWEFDIEQKCLSGSNKLYINKQYPGYKEHIGLSKDSIYINSGVLLMNLRRIRSLNKVSESLRNARKLRRIIRIQDQDIINITFEGEILPISKKYNYTDSDRRENTIDNNEVVIVHFNTSNKPWRKDFIIDETNKYFFDKYQKYRKIMHMIMG